MVDLSRVSSRLPRAVWVILPLVWMCAIFVLSSRPSVKVSGEYWMNFLFFKSLHIAEYGILMLLNTMTYHKLFPRWTMRRVLLFASISAVLYAMSDEIHQTFVPTRTGHARDVLIDSLGIGSVYWLLARYAHITETPAARLRTRTS